LELGELKSIDADPAQLRLLFTHIINNSIQYRSPERELSIQIKESLEPLPFKETKSYYCIAISDNGIGIDETYKDKIFNLFEKIEISALGTKQNGMGLSFCKRIMLNHDGWISARKNQQFGTTIYLYFPFST
jgi:signal transduction histidine kinase